ncbi:ATP-binding protein [Paenibacillus sp. YYML68]|uniref:ATP-binding protein n=1 Tax=Paenibacillus sp. YYML68 TaxID=2909250 RepID=UPI00249175EB|nr:ATP-binding protein [Paenibacillus sp. YYML68]
MALQASIPLTNKLHVQNGSHVLYFFKQVDKYIQHAVDFIVKGIELEHYIIVIETIDMYTIMLQKLELMVEPELITHYVRYINQVEFYETYEDFRYERVLNNLGDIIAPYLEKRIEVRMWGQVGWQDQEGMAEKISHYEDKCDITLSELGFITVCCYNANHVSASIQLACMETHPYLMTDDALVLSTLYRHKHSLSHSVLFPELSAQAELESQMDLYKQKLDFVHVVSHEVRNPLTVIKAYSRLLMNKVSEPQDQERLKQIGDYVELIDNEISHIISTEQMLSTEALWRRKLTLPKELVLQVIEVMSIKARTQNIQLLHEVQLQGWEKLMSNATGFKLIISNILSNAIKYSDEGRTVQFKAYCAGGELVLETIDQGCGMSDDQLVRLFQKYEKTNDQRGGQGIGLFMVKQLVEHHQGDIEVQSELGAGTRVTVRLPLH